MEELSAMMYVNQYRREQRYDVIVLDAAPTAESMRFISMPTTLDWYEACHGWCRVAFKDVGIWVVLLVHRRNAKIEFEIMTWPSQSLRQEWWGGRMTHPDCREWAELASAIRTIVARDLQPETVALRTFAEADEAIDW